MALTPGQPMRDIAVDTVFLGSCTNGRIEDLRAAADVIKGHHVADTVRMLVVPGSARVRLQAESEGLDVDLQGGRRRMAGRRLLDVPRDEPRPAGAGRAGGLDLQPQLRRPAGQGRPYAPRVAAGRCRDRGHAARSARRPTWTSVEAGLAIDGQVHHPHRHRAPAAAQQRRHRPDHPGRVPQAGHQDRLRGRAVRRLAQRPGLRAQPAPVRRRDDLDPGPDFGTGSSREHAVWALQNYGFKVVIGSRFGDIFRGNSGKAGLLVAVVDQKIVEELWDFVEANPAAPLTVDLAEREITATVPGRLRDRRLHPLAVAGGTGRHRPDAAPRRSDRRVRADPAGLPAEDPAGKGRIGRLIG